MNESTKDSNIQKDPDVELKSLDSSFEPEPYNYVPAPAIVSKMETLVAERKEFLAERERLAKMPKKPFVREEPRVGRNDPCPCGSGKKYKKCCMKNEI